jgi:hypothetical protein
MTMDGDYATSVITAKLLPVQVRADVSAPDRMATSPPVVVVRPPTRGPWYDRVGAEEFRKHWLPPTAVSTPTLYMLDLNGVWPSSEVLEEVLMRVAHDIKAGIHGPATLAVSTGNSSLRRQIEALASREGVPLYVSDSAEPIGVIAAEPAGDLTATDRETLQTVTAMGGRVAAADVARRLGLNNTAASNRLTNLAAKGYLKRQSRPGRDGDMFVDPRFLSPEQTIAAVLAAAEEALSPDEFARTARLLRPQESS